MEPVAQGARREPEGRRRPLPQRYPLPSLPSEFQYLDHNRVQRGKAVFKIILDLQSYFSSILDSFDAIADLKYQLNCYYSQLISFHCSKYLSVITTEDLKEFYLAKVELYAIEQVKQFQEQLHPLMSSKLQELYQKQLEFIRLRQELQHFLQGINDTNHPVLSHFDIQRMNNVVRLSNKLLSLFMHQMAQNIFNNKEVRTSLFYIFQDINQLSEQYLDTIEDIVQHKDQEYYPP